MKNTTTILFAALSITALSACRTGTDARIQSAVSETSMASSSGGTNTILDADNGAVARAINDAEIEMARRALANASSQQVRDYAQMMITDHTAANEQLQAGGYAARSNPITLALGSEIEKINSRLNGKTGESFDREYISSQINMHQSALELMRTTLTSSAQEERLRTTLRTMRETVQMHLEHARMIQTQLKNNR